MRWACAAAEEPDLLDGLFRAVAAVREQLVHTEPDLVVVFVSDHHHTDYSRLGRELARAFPKSVRIGCSAKGVLGEGREIEQGPGLVISAASLPDVTLQPFWLRPDVLTEDTPTPAEWVRRIGVGPEHRPDFLLFADPLSMNTERLLEALDRTYPESAKIGGLASAAHEPGKNVLFQDDDLAHSGAVGVALHGNIALDTLVAQGCRPVGNPMFVTRCQDNLLQEVDGRSPLEILGSLYAQASPDEQELFRSALFMGIEMMPAQSQYRPGDFLVRSLQGSGDDSKSLLISAPLREAQVVQFHLRDAATAARELEEHLAAYPTGRAAGALLFSCLGRGQALFGEPGHDSNTFRKHQGDIPLGGFFGNGEIGPVGQRTFLHGVTSAFGLIRPKAS